jgi:hypothetical protein
MSTSNLFVELIVIGVGAFIWILLFTLSLFGVDWIPVEQIFSYVAAIPILAIIYVLGIISDRVADAVFEWLWSDDLRGAFFTDRKEYYNSRRIILTRSQRLSDLLEYGRSRLRICRGWTFNSILILISYNTFLFTQLSGQKYVLSLSIFGSLFILLIVVGAWFSWRNLVLSEYLKIKEQAEYVALLKSEELN